jgi:hypothetical protein
MKTPETLKDYFFWIAMRRATANQPQVQRMIVLLNRVPHDHRGSSRNCVACLWKSHSRRMERDWEKIKQHEEMVFTVLKTKGEGKGRRGFFLDAFAKQKEKQLKRKLAKFRQPRG